MATPAAPGSSPLHLRCYRIYSTAKCSLSSLACMYYQLHSHWASALVTRGLTHVMISTLKYPLHQKDKEKTTDSWHQDCGETRSIFKILCMKMALRLITSNSLSLGTGLQSFITRLQLGDHTGSNIYERVTRTLKVHLTASHGKDRITVLFLFFTLSCSRNSQQYHRMSLICLIHRRVRSLERARDTYHTCKQ